ncbi:MAG: MFS transporter [Sulfurimonadaceae bacterium]|jgi:MFS family permease|nr:MFS transporter [Sulfurimonadaceae bacterium]
MKHYVLLLQSEPILRRLSTIQLIAYFGAWFSNVAIYTLLLDMKVSATVIAFTAALHFLAGILQAPFSGSLIDKLAPKKLMLWLTSIEICATLLLLLVTDVSHIWLLFVLIFLRMAAASFYFTTEMSLLPKILTGEKLQKANEIHSIIWSVSYTLGMALSGFVVYWLGVKVAFFLDAMMFVIAFYLLYTLPLHIAKAEINEKFFAMMRDTFVYFKQNPKAVHLMMMHAFVGLTAFDALIALMVDKYYASIIATSLALGLINTFRALGLVIGPMVLGKWINNRRLLYVLLAQAMTIWLWAYMLEYFYLSLVASIFVGFFTTTLWSYTYTLLQKNIDAKYYGRIVAYNDMLFLTMAAAVSLMIGYLATLGFSLEFITALLGGGFFIATLYYWWILKNITLKEAA